MCAWRRGEVQDLTKWFGGGSNAVVAGNPAKDWQFVRLVGLTLALSGRRTNLSLRAARAARGGDVGGSVFWGGAQDDALAIVVLYVSFVLFAAAFLKPAPGKPAQVHSVRRRHPRHV